MTRPSNEIATAAIRMSPLWGYGHLVIFTQLLENCNTPPVPSLLLLLHLINTEVHSLRKKATIHQVTTIMPVISKNVLLPGHNHLLTISTDDPDILLIARVPAMMIIKVKGYQYWWLAGGYDLEIGHF